MINAIQHPETSLTLNSSCSPLARAHRSMHAHTGTAGLFCFSPGPGVCKPDCLLQLSQAWMFLRFVTDEDRLSKRDVLVVCFQSNLWNSWGWFLALPDTSFLVSHFSLSVTQLCRTQTQCFSLPKGMEGSMASPGHRWKLTEPIVPLHKLLQHLGFVGFGDFCLFACFGTTDIHLPSDPEPLAIPLEQHGQRAGNDAHRDLTELMKRATENKQHFEPLDPCCYWMGCKSTTDPELCTKQGKSSRKMVYILTIWLHLKDTTTTASAKEIKGVKTLAKET